MDKRPNPTTIRMPQRHTALLAAIREKTGMTATQAILQAIEAYAKALGIKV